MGATTSRAQRDCSRSREAAQQGDEADEAFGGMVARMDMPPHARAGQNGRGHRFAAYPRCSADTGGTGMNERGAVGLEHLYVWTATLLLAHQIDSAYWHEWRLFGVPGGVQTFVLINVPLVLVFLYGLVQLVRFPRVGARFALALAAVGVAAFILHAWFLWQGHPEFRTPASLGILAGAFVLSIELGRRSAKMLITRG
jgi:hypothetical protein